jgi:uroporphyrin-III C-methyltransferase/precorrin-2 dehydrogenase/sirohydrochlorin ferrochelatase
MRHFPVFLDLRANADAAEDARVTVGNGTESAAPMLARKIKAGIAAMLPLGVLARIGRAPEAGGGPAQAEPERVLADGASASAGFVHLVGTGPGDPELLTLKARRLLHEADVVIHDRLVPQAILELARREALILEVGKTAYRPSWKQDDINALIVRHAQAGATVVRLKGGDPAIFGRLDDEISALEAAGLAYGIVPGVTSASAAAAAIGQSLTRRGRNSSFRILTGHDVAGFAEQDWRDLARAGSTAAIYMGVKAATFLRGRLLMHGARADTPVTAVENASRPEQRVIATTLIDLPRALAEASPQGPVMLLWGVSPRSDAAAPDLREAL